MKKLFCTLLSAAAAVALLCGFTPSPQENSAGAGLITKTYETAEAISSLSVSDKYADVTVKADDVDHVVVEYSYNSSYNDAFGTGGELYSFTIAGPSLNIQGLKGDASMSVNNSKCIWHHDRQAAPQGVCRRHGGYQQRQYHHPGYDVSVQYPDHHQRQHFHYRRAVWIT